MGARRPISAIVCLAIGVAGVAVNAGAQQSVVSPIDLTGVAPAPETFGDEDLWHVQFVMDDEQKLRYIEMSPKERAEFLRVIWASIDPTPTTPVNERKIDHFRRLTYVRDHFSTAEPPYWDKRGELLLRYGPPDARTVSDEDIVVAVGLIAAREVWVYQWLGQAYRLEDQGFDGNFQDHYDLTMEFRDTNTFRQEGEVQSGSRRNVRQPIGVDYDPDLLRESAEMREEADFGSSEFVVLDGEQIGDMDRMRLLYSEGQDAYVSRPAAYAHDHGGEKLEFVFDIANFAREGTDRTRVDVNTAFWANDLEYMPEPRGYVAVLGVEAVVKTLDYREVARVAGTTRDPKGSVEDLEGRLVLDQLWLELEPGPYRLALSVRDSLSRNVGIYTTEMEVRSFDGLQLSDVQLALDVRSAPPGAPFSKGPYQVVPYPFGTFPKDRDIYLYFEIYGLEGSPTGDVFYTVDLLIKPREETGSRSFRSSKGRVVPGVATSFEGRGREGIVREYIVLDPSSFSEDVYDVEITVHDRVFEREATQAVHFGVEKR